MNKDPKALAIGFEAVRYSMSQSKDGYKLTLVIHPDDVNNELTSHPIGTRYQVALVEVDDQGEPVNRKRTEGEQAVAAAGMLCRNPDFQRWCYVRDAFFEPSEDGAKAYIYQVCGILSRAELASQPEARKRFDAMRLAFSRTIK